MDNIKMLLPLERPRERLQLYGPQVLSDAELLAVVFGSGQKGLPVSTICNSLLSQIPLKDLPRAEIRTLCGTKGIGEAKALVLLAIVELSRRLTQPDLFRLESRDAVVMHCRAILDQDQGLSYLLLLMTVDRELLAICELGMLLPDITRVITLSVESGAKRIQLLRNGWLMFSQTEMKFMRNLEQACATLGIIVCDLLAIDPNEHRILRGKV